MDADRAVDDLIARVTDALRLPAAAAADLEALVQRFFEPLQLVPRREFDAHRAAMDDLRSAVARLEERLDALDSR